MGEFGQPTWNPDGTGLAWVEDDGVHVASFSNVATCAHTGGGLVIPGATSPDWGPAPVAPAPRPSQAPAGAGPAGAGQTPSQGGTPPGPATGTVPQAASFVFGAGGRAPRARVLGAGGRRQVVAGFGGVVRPPSGVTTAAGCVGRLTLTARSGGPVLATRTLTLAGSCALRLRVKVPAAAVHRRRLSLRLVFAGNESTAGFDVRTTVGVPR